MVPYYFEFIIIRLGIKQYSDPLAVKYYGKPHSVRKINIPTIINPLKCLIPAKFIFYVIIVYKYLIL